MEFLVLVQLCVVLGAIFIGARIGGTGLGMFGAVGLCILVFVFGLQPGKPPIDVMLIIMSVITAASALQAAGGLDYLVRVAEKGLKKRPGAITFLGPIVCYLFTFMAGTGHIIYSLLPVIAEIATESKVRPERPISVSVIASQQAITASPISAATAALLSPALLGQQGIELIDMLKICVPATFIGVLVAAFVVQFRGKDLEKDPEYQKRLQQGYLKRIEVAADKPSAAPKARLAVWIFISSVILVILFGSVPALRPTFLQNNIPTPLEMPALIEIIMMSAAGLIIIFSKTPIDKAVKGSVFSAGAQAVIAIFGIAWLGDTFFKANTLFFKTHIESIVTNYPFLFALALFFMSVLIFSEAATVRTFYPLGIALGLPAWSLVAMFPAVTGLFLIPTYPTLVAAVTFDRTGTTKVGKYVFNHSFFLPGIIATTVSVSMGFLFIALR